MLTIKAQRSAFALIACVGVFLTLSATARADAPYTGLDTWYGYGASINESSVVQMVNAAAVDGLRAAGYRYIWIDAGWWMGARNPDGSIEVDPAQWPHGMAWLARYIHARGFLAGIYEETGDTACYNGGALGHVQQDVNTFAAWGYDALKVDYCGDEASLHRDPANVFGEFAHAIGNDRPHRRMILNACDPDTWDAYPLTAYAAWRWGPKTATAWRTDTDLSWPGGISWAHLLRNVDADAAHPGAAGNGHWNDPDYLAPTLFPFGQARAQFTMWAILAAPMMVGANPSALSPAVLRMLTNRRVLAISQDRLGVQGRAVKRIGQVQLWVKPLADASKAIALLNRGPRAERVSIHPGALMLGGKLEVLDVWTGARWRANRITITIRGTSARLLRVRGAAG